jgi:hypothetical protein
LPYAGSLRRAEVTRGLSLSVYSISLHVPGSGSSGTTMLVFLLSIEDAQSGNSWIAS